VPLIDQSSLRNALLHRLQPEDFALLAPHLEPVELHHHMVLSEPDQPSEHAYFFERGLGSVIPVSSEQQKVEAGLFGRDGFWPASLALGTDRSPYQAIVQIAGEGYRMPVAALRQAIAASRPLHELLLRFAQALSVQISYTALSNAVQPVDERLVTRWRSPTSSCPSCWPCAAPPSPPPCT
jgi:CRP-like cAMP-binding protein